jgi:hypothetical protein
MSGSPAAPTPPLSPAEMQVLIARAGLTLNPGQDADLVLAWRQIVGLLSQIPLDRPLLDDQAFVFRLPPPAASTQPAAAQRGPATTPRTPKTAAARTPKKTAPRTLKKAAPRTRKKPAPSTGKKTAPRTGKKTTAPRAAKKAAARNTVQSLSSGGHSARPGGRR